MNAAEAFLGGLAGAFMGVICARVVGAWTVRRAFARMREATADAVAKRP